MSAGEAGAREYAISTMIYLFLVGFVGILGNVEYSVMLQYFGRGQHRPGSCQHADNR